MILDLKDGEIQQAISTHAKRSESIVSRSRVASYNGLAISHAACI